MNIKHRNKTSSSVVPWTRLSLGAYICKAHTKERKTNVKNTFLRRQTTLFMLHFSIAPGSFLPRLFGESAAFPTSLSLPERPQITSGHTRHGWSRVVRRYVSQEVDDKNIVRWWDGISGFSEQERFHKQPWRGRTPTQKQWDWPW